MPSTARKRKTTGTMPETVEVADRYVLIHLHNELDYEDQMRANELFDRITDSEGEDIDAMAEYVTLILYDDITVTEAKSFTPEQSLDLLEASLQAVGSMERDDSP